MNMFHPMVRLVAAGRLPQRTLATRGHKREGPSRQAGRDGARSAEGSSGNLPDAKEFYLNISVNTVASESERVRRRVPPCILMI